MTGVAYCHPAVVCHRRHMNTSVNILLEQNIRYR